jgi:glycosyltransferase involved in cell wall biosynthesis
VIILSDSSVTLYCQKEDSFMDNHPKRIKIAILIAHTLQNPKRSSWAGTVDQMTNTLQKHCGDVYSITPKSSLTKLFGKIINKLSRIFLRKIYLYNHTFALAREYAKATAPQLKQQSFDVIFAPGGGTEIAFLETDIPIVLIEDANFVLLHNYYPGYSNLLKRSAYETNALEELALKRASLILHPSEWAVQSTIENYLVDKRKVQTIPFGANFKNPPSIEVVQARKKSDRCRLFFLGVDWQRKGGEIAFETLLKLEEMGIQAELIICGCTPPSSFSHERLKVIPYLDKKDESQRRELEKLFETSDFLLLPTRSECYGMVFCEASAYGLPSITTNTGGVCGAVKDGENGFMLPLSARGQDYAEVIANVYSDDRLYYELVRSSRAAFEDRLNWDAWGMSVKNLLDQLIFQGMYTGG